MRYSLMRGVQSMDSDRKTKEHSTDRTVATGDVAQRAIETGELNRYITVEAFQRFSLEMLNTSTTKLHGLSSLTTVPGLAQESFTVGNRLMRQALQKNYEPNRNSLMVLQSLRWATFFRITIVSAR